MFRPHTLLSGSILALLLLLVPAPRPAHAQIGDLIKDAAKDQLEKEIEALVRNSVKCVFDDLRCIRAAEESGESVVLTDEEGEVIMNDEGRPVQSQEDLPPEKREEAERAASTTAVAAESDFERGERAIVFYDYGDDVPGDFPRSYEFLGGNAEIATVDGTRMVKLLERSRFAIPLPEALPDRFTLEFDYYQPGSGQEFWMATALPAEADMDNLEGHVLYIDSFNDNVGLQAWNIDVGSSMSELPEDRINEGPVAVQLMVDGEYAKMYVNGVRVSNLPRAILPRGDKLYVSSIRGTQEEPIYMGPVRVHAGGRDLYSALEAEGRVAVNDILFETDEATILPASAETLEQIAGMLRDHPDLQILIEGHTDDQGGFQHNMELSEDRAEAVKSYLVDELGIAAERFQTMGAGSTRPVASNETEDGRRQNRRVELVKIGG